MLSSRREARGVVFARDVWVLHAARVAAVRHEAPVRRAAVRRAARAVLRSAIEAGAAGAQGMASDARAATTAADSLLDAVMTDTDSSW